MAQIQRRAEQLSKTRPSQYVHMKKGASRFYYRCATVGSY